MRTILVAGATGLIGSTVVEQLGRRKDVRTVALVRRPLEGRGERLVQWLAPADDLLQGLKPEPVDAVICCLGTTIRTAGSRERFRHVDHELVVGLARWAKQQGVPVFCVVSAVGADAGSSIFYNRVKGEMERDLKAMGLPALHIFHPSILTGPRKEVRIGERVGIAITRLLAPLMVGGLAPYKPMPHDVLAKALIRASGINGTGGTYTYHRIVELAH
jgi:uncharacterized protein YbjT (DUF2867 family)